MRIARVKLSTRVGQFLASRVMKDNRMKRAALKEGAAEWRREEGSFLAEWRDNNCHLQDGR